MRCARRSGIGDRGSGIGDRGSGIGDRGSGIGNRAIAPRIHAAGIDASHAVSVPATAPVFPAQTRAEKKMTSQNRSRPRFWRSDASTACMWHSGPGRTGFAFRRLPAMLVAARTSRPTAYRGVGREPHPPSTRSSKSCPELSLRPGFAGALFLDACPVAVAPASRRLMLRRSKIRLPSSSVVPAFLRPQAHCAVAARISSTGCSSCRDAVRALLTCLVRSVYVPDSRGDATQRDGHDNESWRSPRMHPTPIGPPMAQRLFCVRVAIIRSGHTDAAGRRRRRDDRLKRLLC